MAETLDLKEIGASGLKRTGGFLQEEWLPQLSGRRALQVYREMKDNDATIGAILYAADMLVRQVDWRVEPAGGSLEDQANAEFLRQCMEDMSHTWPDFLSEVMSMLPYGFSPFEIVYKRREGDVRDPSRRSMYNDGKIGWRKFAIRAQESIEQWEFGEDGGLKGFWQVPPPDYHRRFIPIEKALLFRTTAERNNPEGRSILRSAYRSWYFLKRIQEIEAIGIERDLAGLPVIEVPPELLSPNATPEQKQMVQMLLQVVTQVRRDQKEGVVMPAEEQGQQKTGYRFRLLSTGGRRQFDTNAIIRRYELNIAMSALTQFLFLGTQGVGSFALASSQTNLFAMALGAYMESIAAVLNRFAVPRLFALNGIKATRLPTIVHGDMEAPSAEEVARIIQSMASAGAMLFPNRELETAILRLLKLPGPPPDSEEEAITRARQHITDTMKRWGLLRRASRQAAPA